MAAEGDGDALGAVLAAVRDDVYGLALRMLWHPQDAEDATQEALIRIMTRINSYRGEAAFRTWVYRVAVNHLVNFRKSRVEQENLNFRRFADELHEGLAEPGRLSPEASLLTEEVKLGCTLGMLLCLDRDHRVAYILTEVFDLSSADAAYICGVTPTALRKRASRARARLREFVSEHCGLVTSTARCRCDRRVDAAVAIGRVRPNALDFAGHHRPDAEIAQMERLHDLASLMRSHPHYEAPERVRAAVKAVIDSGNYRILD